MLKRSAVIVFSLMTLIIPTHAKADISLGVLANRGDVKVREEYSELADQLEKDVGQPVKLIPLAMEKIDGAVANKEVDLILTNPAMSAMIVEKHKGKPLATVNTDKGSEFGGVIFASKASGISKSSDLKGKKVMSYGTDSAGGYLFQVYHLKQKGIDAKSDFASFSQAKKQDDIPMAVKTGLYDAGFVRTGVLEGMQKKGLLKLDDFIIVDKVNDNFPEVHSTALYPEWFVIARDGLDAAVEDKVKASLLNTKADSPAAQKASIKGFVPAIDLAPLSKVLKELKVAPFDK